MDNDALHSALLSLILLSDQIHATRSEVAMANGQVPEGLRCLLEGMERDLDIAKATLAKEVGLPLCRCCWPPQVIVAPDGKNGSCMGLTGQKPRGMPSPSKRKSHSEFIVLQKAKLLNLRDVLLDSISGPGSVPLRARANAGGSASASGDVADAGRDTLECDLALTLLSQEQEAIAEIDRALDRLQRGVYGLCEISGKRIPRERLEAIPFARYTVECQSQIERRRPGRSLTRARPLFDDSAEESEEDENRQTRIAQVI